MTTASIATTIAKLGALLALPFAEAFACVLREVTFAPRTVETVALREACDRVLAQDIVADRDYPPFNRSMRDGYAVRAADIPGNPKVVGEVRAGQLYIGSVQSGEAVSIMTGAPVPDGADAVVMVEHSFDMPIAAGANISPNGCEAAAGSMIVPRGTRIDYTIIGALATTGNCTVQVYSKPRVAIIATGDEIVEIDRTPETHQIRNSNAYTLAAQVERAGAVSHILPVAKDNLEHTRALIEQGFEHDLLLLSGGVSAGKYDVVEPALAQLGAEFFFDRILIQPGAPLVFGSAQGKYFFGLPGNPASTMVTFELFARPAIGRLSGEADTSLPVSWARLAAPFRHKPGLTRFLPASLNGGDVMPVKWHGSGDIPSLCRSNCYLIADPERADYALGDMIQVLAK